MLRPPGHRITASEFEADARAGLSKTGQKELYSKYLYDDLGSALFDAITLLPEYGLTRADMRLLRKHARQLPTLAGNPSVIVELGSGSGEKARTILPHFLVECPLTYCPIDLSAAALTRCQRDLDDLRNLTIIPIEDSYIQGLASASKARRARKRMMVLFLGSSVGNFEPAVAEGFLGNVHGNLEPGDLLLLSTDLIKPLNQMLAAYDDSLGLTAAFNLNLLARINRDLNADFVLDRFQHEARYDAVEQRIEMHLRSSVDQSVSINDFRVSFREGETIWTESSYKFKPEQVREMGERNGFRCEVQWIDDAWPFAQTLFRAV
jgi:dimethylhistidine N-methyltransferase